jgi:hypothetical protein
MFALNGESCPAISNLSPTPTMGKTHQTFRRVAGTVAPKTNRYPIIVHMNLIFRPHETMLWLLEDQVMQAVTQQKRENSDRRKTGVALKAFGNVMIEWKLSQTDAAAIADMSESTWKRVRGGTFNGDLTRDQMLRMSAVIGIYKSLKLYFDDPIAFEWITLPNDGPLFRGQKPVTTMIADGLPQFLRVRAYLDALRGGA